MGPGSCWQVSLQHKTKSRAITVFCAHPHLCLLLLPSVVRNLSEMELNPSVLTNLGPGSEKHGQVAGKLELRAPS